MKVKVKKVNDYTVELSADVPWRELEVEFNLSVKKFSKKIKMPGFRSGKIPVDRLLTQFKQNIEAEFVDNNIQKYYLQGLKKENLNPVNRAEIKDVSFQMNEDFSFTALFEIEPDIDLPKLKKNSLSVKKVKYIHDKKDVEDAMMQLRKAHATIKTVEDGAAEGDYLTCSLQKLDETGVPIIGKKFEKQYLRVGNGSFTDDQKEKMIGLKPGGKARINLQLNKEENKSEYELEVDSIEREILPELNKEFIKKINPKLGSLEQLRNDVEDKIIANFNERSQTSYERDLSDAVIEKANPSFAPSMVENYLINLIEDVKKQNNGEPLDEQKVREHYKPLAERNVKWYSLRNKIIEKGGLAVSDQDVNNEIQKLIDRTPQSEIEIKKFYKKPSSRKRLKDELIEKLILKYLEQFAKVEELQVKTEDLRGNEYEH